METQSGFLMDKILSTLLLHFLGIFIVIGLPKNLMHQSKQRIQLKESGLFTALKLMFSIYRKIPTLKSSLISRELMATSRSPPGDEVSTDGILARHLQEGGGIKESGYNQSNHIGFNSLLFSNFKRFIFFIFSIFSFDFFSPKRRSDGVPLVSFKGRF